jgi:hypothetical protein
MVVESVFSLHLVGEEPSKLSKLGSCGTFLLSYWRFADPDLQEHSTRRPGKHGVWPENYGKMLS